MWVRGAASSSGAGGENEEKNTSTNKQWSRSIFVRRIFSDCLCIVRLLKQRRKNVLFKLCGRMIQILTNQNADENDDDYVIDIDCWPSACMEVLEKETGLESQNSHVFGREIMLMIKLNIASITY